ncbi:MAG TPA: hypothetical protein VIS06_16800 [Mycobacteriales bacterium]
MRRMWAVLAVAAVVAGCGSNAPADSGDSGGGVGGAASPAAEVQCHDLVGKPAGGLVDPGCVEDGQAVSVLTYTCSGEDFYAASDGQGHAWWGRKSGTVESGSDTEAQAAHTACINGS